MRLAGDPNFNDRAKMGKADLGKTLSPRSIQVQGNVSVKSSAGLHEMRLHPRTASSGFEGGFPINHHQGSFPGAASIGDVPTSDGTWVPRYLLETLASIRTSAYLSRSFRGGRLDFSTSGAAFVQRSHRPSYHSAPITAPRPSILPAHAYHS